MKCGGATQFTLQILRQLPARDNRINNHDVGRAVQLFKLLLIEQRIAACLQPEPHLPVHHAVQTGGTAAAS